ISAARRLGAELTLAEPALAEDIAEDVLEVGIPGKSRAALVARPALPSPRLVAVRARLFGVETRLHASHAELVVEPALFGITEDVVGLGDGLELLLRLLVAGIDVGVMLARQLTVGLLDVGGARRPRHPQGGVQVLLRHRAVHLARPPPRTPLLAGRRCLGLRRSTATERATRTRVAQARGN